MPDRALLQRVLKKQYSGFSDSKALKNIELLASGETYTICTGHQLNIFTGPLYFIFKIVSTIKLANTLKENFPEKNFVPVYWMATEDHDFAEINHTYLSGRKIEWNHSASGAVGRLRLHEMEAVVKAYTETLGISENAQKLTEIIENSYAAGRSLADATRQLADDLFGEYGLVVLDADDKELKKQFAAFIWDDITVGHSFKNIVSTNKELEELGIEPQVQPREINFFYLKDDLRERIVAGDDTFQVLNTEISFTEPELKKEITEHPERFSPNVVIRPLYQELILPNLAYIGGGAEMIYWLQLKRTFDYYGIDFPILVLRNSGVFAPGSFIQKLQRLDLSYPDIFVKTEDLIKKWVLNHTEHELDLKDEWQELSCIFEKIKLRAHKIDPTLEASTEAVRSRLHQALKNLEKKLLKAEKRNYSEALAQIAALREKLFPNGVLQERRENFGLFYVKYGEELIPGLIRSFEPLDPKFTILEE